MHKKNNKAAKWIFMFLGIFAIVFGIVSKVQRSKYQPVEAKIVRIESEYNTTDERYDYHVFVDYAVDGQEYKNAPLDFHKDGFAEGQTIEIRYNPENPQQITGTDTGFIVYLLILGPILILVGLFLLIRGK